MEAEGTNRSSSSFLPECLFSAVPFLPYMHLRYNGENNVPLSCAFTKAFPILSASLKGAHITNPSPSPAIWDLALHTHWHSAPVSGLDNTTSISCHCFGHT